MGNSETEKEDINWGSDEDEDDLKRFDFGLSLGAGVELDAFQIGLSYGMGLANISPYTGNGMKTNNRVLAITGSYRIGE